jgi:hypothetical protein
VRGERRPPSARRFARCNSTKGADTPRAAWAGDNITKAVSEPPKPLCARVPPQGEAAYSKIGALFVPTLVFARGCSAGVSRACGGSHSGAGSSSARCATGSGVARRGTGRARGAGDGAGRGRRGLASSTGGSSLRSGRARAGRSATADPCSRSVPRSTGTAEADAAEADAAGADTAALAGTGAAGAAGVDDAGASPSPVATGWSACCDVSEATP